MDPNQNRSPNSNSNEENPPVPVPVPVPTHASYFQGIEGLFADMGLIADPDTWEVLRDMAYG